MSMQMASPLWAVGGRRSNPNAHNAVVRRGGSAGVVAGVGSGVPSTAIDRHPVEAMRAAGSLLGKPTVPRGVVAHLAISLWWGLVLARLLPRRPSLAAGAAAGVGIAALDLGVIGRWFPRIRALPAAPQVADH